MDVYVTLSPESEAEVEVFTREEDAVGRAEALAWEACGGSKDKPDLEAPLNEYMKADNWVRFIPYTATAYIVVMKRKVQGA